MTEPTAAQLLDKEFWRDKSNTGDDDDLREKRARAMAELRNLHRDHDNTELRDVGMRVSITHEAHLLIDLIEQYNKLIRIPF